MTTKLWSDATRKRTSASDNAELRDSILQTQTARTAEATSITSGGITLTDDSSINVLGGGDVVVDGGSVFVRGFGGITVEQGARIVAEYPDGSPGLYFGALLSSGDLTPMGTGLLTRRSQSQGGALIARIFEGQDGVAVASFDVDGFDVDATGDIIFDATGTGQIHGDTLAQVTSLGQAALAGQGGSFILREDTGLAANMYMGTDGRVYRSTSSIRYKSDVQDLSIDPQAVLQLRPRSWIHQPVPQCPDWLHEQHGNDGTCPAMQETPEPDPDAERAVGFIAEELVGIGLGDFVEFNNEGEPEAIHYDRLTAAFVPLVQQQQAHIEALTAQLQALADRVTALETTQEA